MTEVEARSIFMEHIEEHNNSNFIFTYGSKSSAGVGFGVYSADFLRRGALPASASIFTAELYAILAAIEKIALMDIGNFTVFCDSKSVLQALGAYNSNNPLVIKILQWIYLIQRKGTLVKFCWVPAHVGVQGNEEADRIAKQAAIELLPRRCPLLFRDFFPYIRSLIRDMWQDRWSMVTPNKMKEITSVVSPWEYGRMPRRWEVVLCRLRIGHTNFTHKYLMVGDYQPFCEDCLVPLTVRHLLVEWPSQCDLRHRYLSEALGRDGRYILAKILGEDVVFDASGIFRFIKEAGLLTKI